MEIFKLSPSALNLMKDCPRCFWLTQNTSWKRPQGPFASVASGIDRIAKTHFDNFRKKKLLPPELCDNGDCENMKLFDDWDKMKEWRNNFKGISWSDRRGNILKGAVDDILIRNGKLIVLDYKTRGYDLKEDTTAHYKLQLNLYNFLLRKNGYETEDFAFLLFYIPKEIMAGGEIIFDTKLVKMKVDTESSGKIWNEAIKLLNSDCPDKSCEWCEGR